MDWSYAMYYIPPYKNYLQAQTLIGVDYVNGNGVQQNYNEALNWFKKAASEMYAPAQNQIGLLYKNGHGVYEDLSQAFEWFQLAADQGYDEAQINLALMYKEGLGTEKDEAQAIQWLEQAASQGNDIAKYNLELIHKPVMTAVKEEDSEQDSEDVYVLTGVLDNIDERIKEIEEKIALLLEDEDLHDEEQALLDLIYKTERTLEQIENYDLEEGDEQEVIRLSDELEQGIMEIYERLMNMNEKGVTLEKEEHIDELIQRLMERLEAL